MHTLHDIRNYVTTLLGGNGIAVELSDADWDQIFPQALSSYSRYRPKIKETLLPVVGGKVSLRGLHNLLGVLEVIPTTDHLPSTTLSTGYLLGLGSRSVAHQAHLVSRDNIIEAEAGAQVYRYLRDRAFDSDEWRYDEDSQTLNVQGSASGFVMVRTLHKRRLGTFALPADAGIANLGSITEQGRYDVLPQSILATSLVSAQSGQLLFRVDEDSNCVAPDGTVLGDIDLDAGTLTFTVNRPVEGFIHVNEVRTTDLEWFQNYVYALACMTLGNMRSRYGSIPGVESDIQLDTDKLQQGTDLINELEQRAAQWQYSWLPSSIK